MRKIARLKKEENMEYQENRGQITEQEWGKIWAKAWLGEIQGNDTFKRALMFDPAAGAYAVREEFKLKYTKLLDLYYTDDQGDENGTRFRDMTYEELERIIVGDVPRRVTPSEWNFDGFRRSRREPYGG